MNTLSLLNTCAILLLSLSLVNADSKTEVKDAIKKLSDQPNYAWTSTPKTEGSEAARRQGPTEGKTEKGAFTHIKSSSGDNPYEAAFKGEKRAVNFAGNWVTAEALGENAARVTNRLKALRTPVEEAEELVNKAKELKRESEGLYSSDLTAEGAKELFSRLGRRAAEAPEAKGAIKFWIKDGLLTKYEYSLQGKMTVGEDKREVDLARTVTVEIKDVGATKVSLPEELQKKLS